jgi:hypothetical protein
VVKNPASKQVRAKGGIFLSLKYSCHKCSCHGLFPARVLRLPDSLRETEKFEPASLPRIPRIPYSAVKIFVNFAFFRGHSVPLGFTLHALVAPTCRAVVRRRREHPSDGGVQNANGSLPWLLQPREASWTAPPLWRYLRIRSDLNPSSSAVRP